MQTTGWKYGCCIWQKRRKDLDWWVEVGIILGNTVITLAVVFLGCQDRPCPSTAHFPSLTSKSGMEKVKRNAQRGRAGCWSLPWWVGRSGGPAPPAWSWVAQGTGLPSHMISSNCSSRLQVLLLVRVQNVLGQASWSRDLTVTLFSKVLMLSE